MGAGWRSVRGHTALTPLSDNQRLLFAVQEVRICKNCDGGRSFPNTDRPRPANNALICFS